MLRTMTCAGAAILLWTGCAPAAAAAPKLDLDPFFRSIAPDAPGCGVGVAIPGAPPVLAAYGQADLEHPAPLTAASVFETGSLAKQFTAAAMMLLVQDGKLSLDDDIRRHLPEMPDYGTPITIRHLLNHTSGLREQWSLLALTGNGPGAQVHTLATVLELASRQKGLNFRPGAEFLYANTNYTLAAIIIERVSGQSLQRFTDQRLFRPLGMSQTRWREDFRTVVPGRAMGYAPDGAGFVANMPFTNVYGNGGLLTTVADLLRWNAFLDKPSVLPGGPALVAALETPGRLNDGSATEYGLGLEVTRNHGRRLVAHNGSTAGYKTWLGRFPDEGVSVALMCNNGLQNPVELGERVARHALAVAGHADTAISTPKSGAPASTRVVDVAAYQGLFHNPKSGDVLEVQVVDGRLALKLGAMEPLTALGEDRFQRPNGDIVTFVRRDGKAAEFTLSLGGTRQTFVWVKAADKDSATLAAYVGDYYSAELDRRVSVVRRGDGLVMRQPFGVEWKLTPSFADGFSTPLRGSTTFVFKRAPGGGVEGFGAWANGVRDLAFVRQ